MDILNLIKGAPELLESIQAAGISEDKINPLGDAITSQLGGSDGFDLGDLLGALDAESFLSKVDPQAVADMVGIQPELVTKALDLISPFVADFSPEGLGKLGSLAGKLFN